jgi:hypothetical protein
LYELVLSERHYYFIQEKDSVLTELVYRVKIDPASLTVINDLSYKNVFSDLFAKANIYSEYQYLITTATYNKPSLVRLMDKLNQVKAGKKITRTAIKENGKLIQIAVIAGGVANTFPTAFRGVYAPAAKMPSSFAPTGGLDFLCVAPGTNRQLRFGVAVQYSEFKGNTTINGVSNDSSSATWVNSTKYTEQLSMSSSLLMSNLYIMYVFTKNSNWNVYGKLGFTLDAVLAKNNYIYSTYTGVTSLYANGNPPQYEGKGSGARSVLTFTGETIGANLSIGMLSDRHKIELAYYTPKQLAGQNQNPFHLSQYGLYYYFTILK